ncbi:DUF3093 domain-containing protein [Streptomyces sp. NBC_00160]|uniref:DUF3093 domain-containing protein n=1 Tax=Streptomyces sp. NBC_00160 TaxID=2903628 RepID=UPI002258687B|nr:DUF3093 domain-containing protein [Streptomyces sp. NBC_00160]MCX5302739.1 DUF3093 domain-containing protein [Streptomyces sp. NBC_00160]
MNDPDIILVATVTNTPAFAFDERLTAPVVWRVIAGAFGLSVALVVLPFGLLAAMGGLAAGTCLAGLFVAAQGRTRIRVAAGLLVIDDARIPLTALGEVEVLQGEEARAWRTYKADMRAFTVMRSYIPTAVRIDNTDPDDPTPYVFVSTRAPQDLATAIAVNR